MLRDYQGKRDFERTPEPSAGREAQGRGPLTFVVQKHSARQLHYDFRLEVDGVLKSWAIAKGPSGDTSIKRLAVMVEDHPLDYAGFEGSIPKGQYGAGQVIVWDRGTYSPDEAGELNFDDRNRAEARMRQGLVSGKLSITLKGEKLKGSWTLVRMQRSDKNWLLIKHRDEYAGADREILEEEASVISGLTIEDLKAGRLPSPADPPSAKPGEAMGAVKAPFPAKIAPMLASPAASPFSDEKWLFEPKLDGFRTLAFVNNGEVRLQSRSGINVTEHYPALTASLKSQHVSQVILDGEIIALDSKGKSCFQCLQNYLKTMYRTKTDQAEPPSAIIYYVFDILFLDGYSLTDVPLAQRKKLLQATVSPDEAVRLVDYFVTDGRTVYSAAIQNGLEGVIAKHQDSLYEPGKRSRTWLKIKAVTSDDFVIGGFTQGTGKRADTFGSLLLGYYDDDKHLRYAGNVGTGFNDDTLVQFKKQLQATIVKKSPFQTEPEVLAGVTWVRPELVAEVKFAERTRDNRLRAPVFLRMREDKPAASVSAARAVEIAAKLPEPDPPDRPGALQNVLAQLAGPKNSLIIEAGGQRVPLSNLDKAIWPEAGDNRGLTKRDLIAYLATVSPWLLPHLKDRPLTLSRYPNGIQGHHFFQKHYQPVPAFVETIPLSSHDTPIQNYILCNNLPTLLWLGQIADIELHAWFSRVTQGTDLPADTGTAGRDDYYTNYPDFLIFDIDPYIYSGKEAAGAEPELNRAAFTKTCQVALKLKQTLDSLSFPSFVKTSGRTGLHVFVPILRKLDFQATRSAAETLSRFLAGQRPDEVTIDWAVEKRTGKVFLDYNQNVRGKTLASIYSPRPSPEASVSVPLRWDELERVYPTDFTILTVPDRLAKLGDLWENILDAKVDLAELLSGIKSRS